MARYADHGHTLAIAQLSGDWLSVVDRHDADEIRDGYQWLAIHKRDQILILKLYLHCVRVRSAALECQPATRKTAWCSSLPVGDLFDHRQLATRCHLHSSG